MSVPVAGLPRRLALSALAGAGRFCALGSGGTRWRGVPAGHRRGLADLQPKRVPRQGFKDSDSWLPKYRSERKSYITNPNLATTLVRILKEEAKSPDQLFLECNPGESAGDHLSLEFIARATFPRPSVGARLRHDPLEQLGWSVPVVTPGNISAAVCT